MSISELDTLVMNQSRDGFFILDDQDSIIYINPIARQILGLEKEEIINKNYIDVFHHHDLKKMISTLRADSEIFQEISFDDNQVYITRCTSIPEVGTIVTLQDITYLKLIERSRNESISTVSHDLRSPLTAISGYVDLLERVGPLNEKQKDFINRVKNNISLSTELINDLLELGGVETGKSKQNTTVQLGEILEKALEAAGLMIGEKEIDLICTIPEDIPPIKGNPIKIRQMVDNLLGNAIKFSPQKGKIKVSIEVKSSQLVFQISDNGPGIPENDQPHIFKKHYRASNTSSKVPGSGLGLNIVKSIVDIHRGRIWVNSSPDEGSIFTVVLPITKTQ